MERTDTNITAPVTPHVHELKRFLRSYARSLTARVPVAEDLAVSGKWLALFPIGGVALALAMDRWEAGADPEFFPQALYVWCWYVLILLTATAVASCLARPRVAYDRVLAGTLAFVPVFVVLNWVRSGWVAAEWDLVAAVAILLYAALYLSQWLRALTARAQRRAVLGVIVTLGIAAGITQALSFSGQFWYPNAGDAESEEEQDTEYWEQMQRAEALFFSQASRIDAAVAGLAPADELPAAAFFLGFAGMGEERVFAGEIALAAKVIGERFGTTERTIQLVNDRRDLESLPLASMTALRYALERIAARMNIEKDVLIIGLSSHGSETGELSVSNGALPLNDLSASDLATALRDSGIKWRVVIVSACYAGNFIEPLRDDNTIVIAAAAADRTSFGCADDRELTYFGEAFYRDSLPGAPTLRRAFEHAAAAIARRERAEKKTPSNPQAHFGPALEAYLDSLGAAG